MKKVRRFLWILPILTLFFIAGCGSKASTSFSPDEVRSVTDSRIKQLAVAVARYIERNNDITPDMTNSDTLKKDVAPFLNEDPVGGDEIFTQADTQDSFQPNPSLSKINELKIDNPQEIVMLYQQTPSPNMTRAVIFFDYHFRRIGENEWPALKQQSGIP